MLSLVEKLEDLKAGLDNDTYIDVILQSLPPSYDPFIVNYNMNGLEKSIHELINMLVQYKATTRKSEPSVLVGEASTSKAKGEAARRWKRKKGKRTRSQPLPAPGVLLLLPEGKGQRKGRRFSAVEAMMCAFIALKRAWRGSVHNSSPTQVLQRSRKLSKDEMILRLGDGKAVAAEAVGSLSLVCLWTLKYFGQRRRFSYFITFTDDHSRYGYVLPDEPASYKYLRVWGSPAYVKRLVGDKLDLRSSLCRFIGYPKETAGYYFYDPAEQKVFVSRNAVFLEKDFPLNNQRDEVLIEESSGEPPHNSTLSFEPTVHTDGVPILRRSTRESRVPERYGFVGLTSQLDNDPKTYGEAMSDIDSDKWLEAMKFKMDSMGSNQGGYGLQGQARGEGVYSTTRVDFEETYSPVAMAKSIRILLAIAAWYDYEIWQMDVKMAFLNGFVEEEIFMDQPEGFTTVGEEQKNDYDPCVYKKINGSSVAYLVLYIDDILLIGNDVKMLRDIKAWLSTQFSMKDMVKHPTSLASRSTGIDPEGC
ncbi:UNVERIFIED_CONTAM: hypothetical protein Slati_3721900 [Sesamum latifolium]|uniref:Reverse transcriptase Ty1/copia-type domain-containing protein n=1 Tax=Sesamum latifolium TaxID=2727402 RepID=A0AAW2U3W9_9LAMI